MKHGKSYDDESARLKRSGVAHDLQLVGKEELDLIQNIKNTPARLKAHMFPT